MLPEHHNPKLIALCGAPGSGKSTLQRILQRLYGIEPVDDGAIIRRHVMEIADLTWEDVSTQEGKLRSSEVFGQELNHRWMLGEYGNAIERLFGDDAIPGIAVRETLRAHAAGSGAAGYSFGSVRRGQGALYKRHGGIVVEVIRRSATGAGYEFDGYDNSLVDFIVSNDYQTEEALEEAVRGSALASWIGDAALAA